MEYALVLGIFCIIAMAIAVIVLGDGRRVENTALKKASFVAFSEQLVEGYTVSNCFSESVYSMRPNKNLMDSCQVLDDKSSFLAWLDTYWDIRRVYPAGAEESTGPKRMAEGYVPIVVSASTLQDCEKQVLVKGIYTDEENNVVIRLGTVLRNGYYRYDHELDTECRQIYTILYLIPDTINKINTLSFAIDRD